ncbi:hypothetical protein EDC01DRAFT_667417 [Geopyxis carbonaria]|nr:hypothetical protein EDC01DRAFT_667417 [Geopyxis carbonaria]
MSTPKRSAPPAESPNGSIKKPRRNPALSCQLCRIKKIKCSRIFPCSNCVTRNVDCIPQDASSVALGANPHAPHATPGQTQFYRYPGVPGPTESFSSRSSPVGGDQKPNPRRSFESSFRVDQDESLLAPSGICMLSMVASREAQIQDRESLKTANLLEELAMGSSGRFAERNKDESMINRFESISKPNTPPEQHVVETPSAVRPPPKIHHPYHESALSRINIFDGPRLDKTISHLVKRLPLEGHAMQLLANYFELVHPIYHLIHEPTLYLQVKDVYTNHFSMETETLASLASLILTVTSIGAYFWPAAKIGEMDLTATVAMQMSKDLQAAAIEALSFANFMSCPTLETVQACILLPLVLHNSGESEAFRNLWGSVLKMGHTLGLHKLGSVFKPGENRILYETKRRAWWYIASSDWLESTHSGPRQGTYCIHKNQISTSSPSNCDDIDITDTTCIPKQLDVPTEMSYYFSRVHLAHISREVIDTLGVNAYSGDNPDYESILSLDARYRAFAKGLPKFYRIDSKSKAETADIVRERPYINWQRIMLHIGMHSMLIRLHSPFLIRGSEEPRVAYSRMVSLKSAHGVLALYRQTFSDTPGFPHAMKLWIGIHQLFISAVVLSIDLCCNEEEPHVNETKKEIMEACEMLERASMESSIADHAVKMLSAIIRQWKRGHTAPRDKFASPGVDNSGTCSATTTPQESTAALPISYNQHPDTGLNFLADSSTVPNLLTELTDFGSLGGSEYVDWGGLLEDLGSGVGIGDTPWMVGNIIG